MSVRATAGPTTPIDAAVSGIVDISTTTLVDGGWVTLWSEAHVDGSVFGVVFRRYDAFGNPVGDIALATTRTAGDQLDADVVALPDGGWLAVYSNYNGGNQDVFLQRFDASGQRVGSETRVNATSQVAQFSPDVAALPDGGWIVVWCSTAGGPEEVKMQRYNADGGMVGVEVTVPGIEAERLDTAVTVLADGGWIVSWSVYDSGAGTSEGHFVRYAADGTALGIETIPVPGMSSPTRTIALGDGGWVYAAMDYYGNIQLRTYDASGALVRERATTSSGAIDLAITALTDGGYVVVWPANVSGGVTLFQQRFSANGDAVGSASVVSDTVFKYNSTPTVTALADGSWVVTWNTADPETSQRMIVQRHFAPDIDGTVLADDLIGTHWNEALFGLAGNDILDGGGGNDTLIGGLGDDRFFVNSLGDKVQELAGQGNDTVEASVSYSLFKTAVENLTLRGTANLNGTGNDLANAIFGNAGANVINGLSGNDTLIGNAGNDTVNGNGGNDLINGGAGDDILTGGFGVDTLSYVGASAGVTLNLGIVSTQVTGGSGSDRVSQFENILGSAFADTLTGDDGNNVIEGAAGNDTLNGGLGIDTASYAGAGAAVTVSLALAGAQATGGAGNDTLSSFENLLGSRYNDTLTGNGQNNVIEGGLGNDVITGLAGLDYASYENAKAAVVVNLSIAGQQNTGQGNDTLTGIEGVIGSAFGDTLTGGAMASRLDGRGGNDWLTGGSGNDTITGGAGNDLLTGLGGADTFVFGNGHCGNAPNFCDEIQDFQSTIDVISLAAMDADTTVAGNQAFIWNPGSSFTASAGELLKYSYGSGFILAGDTDGDGFSDFMIYVSNAIALTSGDIIL